MGKGNFGNLVPLRNELSADVVFTNGGRDAVYQRQVDDYCGGKKKEVSLAQKVVLVYSTYPRLPRVKVTWDLR